MFEAAFVYVSALEMCFARPASRHTTLQKPRVPKRPPYGWVERRTPRHRLKQPTNDFVSNYPAWILPVDAESMSGSRDKSAATHAIAPGAHGRFFRLLRPGSTLCRRGLPCFSLCMKECRWHRSRSPGPGHGCGPPTLLSHQCSKDPHPGRAMSNQKSHH